MNSQADNKRTSLPKVHIAFGNGGVSTIADAWAGTFGSRGAPSERGLRSRRRAGPAHPAYLDLFVASPAADGTAREPPASRGLVALERLVNEAAAHCERLRQAARAASRQCHRARLAASVARRFLIRLLTWPVLQRLQKQAHRAELRRLDLHGELARCAVAVQVELDSATRAAFGDLGQVFAALAAGTVQDITASPAPARRHALAGRAGRAAPARLLERARAEPLVTEAAALRFASTRAGDLYLYPGFGLLHRRRHGLVCIDARELELAAGGPPEGGRGSTLVWHGPEGMTAAYLVDDAVAAQAFCAAFKAYRQKLEQLASRAGHARWPAAPESVADLMLPPITVVPPLPELRLRLFPAADLAVLAAAGLAVLLLVPSPSGSLALPAQAQGTVERLMARAAGLLAGTAEDRPEPTAIQVADLSGPPPRADVGAVPTPSVERGPALVRVSTANIRAEPRTSAAIVDRARRGESLIVLARRAGWVQVDAGGSLGWIDADLVTMD
jgi:hypothetical protein